MCRDFKKLTDMEVVEEAEEMRVKTEAITTLEKAWETTRRLAVGSLSAGNRAAGASGGGAGVSWGGIKREQVDLPKFSGAKTDRGKDLVLEFPIWKVQWEALIQAYPANVRATMILNKTGAEAQVQVAGLEHDYGNAMDRLKAHFGAR